MDFVTLPLLVQMHGHLRQGNQLALFVPFAARYCSYYVAMGNTKPHIANGPMADTYRQEININTPVNRQRFFKPLPAIKVREDTKPLVVREALRMGHKLFKFYPLGKTTHADDGIKNYMNPNLRGCYEAIAGEGGYALFHPEHPGKRWDDTECEYAFFGIFESIYNLVPGLKMVWEHLTDSRVLPFLLEMENRVAMTVTAHHQYLRLNDVLGRNHHLCRPPAKMLRDTETLRHAVTRGLSKQIMLGLDDAPWDYAHKECGEGSCGIWTMPHAAEHIVTVFEEEGMLSGHTIPEELYDFIAGNALAYYGLEEVPGAITVERKEQKVPLAYRLGEKGAEEVWKDPLPSDYAPFRKGETLSWSVTSVE